MDKYFDCDSTVFPAGAAQASGPPAKKQKNVLDRLLGDDEEVESIVTISDEVNAYFEEQPISRKENPLACWKSNSCRFPHLSNLLKLFSRHPHPVKEYSLLQV